MQETLYLGAIYLASNIIFEIIHLMTDFNQLWKDDGRV